MCNQAHISVEGCCWSRGADACVNGFTAFLGIRRCKNWVHKIFSWKYLTIWHPVLPVFPEPFTQSASFLISALNIFQAVLKIRTAVASGLILIEPDGEWLFSHQVHRPFRTSVVKMGTQWVPSCSCTIWSKDYSFPNWIILTLLLKVSCLYMCGSFSGLYSFPLIFCVSEPSHFPLLSQNCFGYWMFLTLSYKFWISFSTSTK